MSTSLFQTRQYNGYIYHPVEQKLYLYDSRMGENFEFIEPVMDVKPWRKYWNKDRVASVQSGEDYTENLADCFYNTPIPYSNGKTYQDEALAILGKWDNAVTKKDQDAVAATITSHDYGAFQNLGVIATSDTVIFQGSLAGLFEEIPTPQLAGKYHAFDDDIIWYPNVPEGSSVEPSKGTGTFTDIIVNKGEGAVEATYRALTVINGAGNPFQRLTNKLQAARAAKENDLVRANLEANTANTDTGVDFGDRSGTPPASQQNPLPTWAKINTYFATYVKRGQPDWDVLITQPFIYTEYINNDVVRGVNQPMGNTSNVDGQRLPIPGVPGKSWIAASEITSATAGWALALEAIKRFRGPTTFFNVASQLNEATRNVLRTYFAVKTVKPELVFKITGIAA